MNVDEIILAIEAEQYDFEPTLRIPGFQEVRNNELILRMLDGSSSVFANKVVRSVFSYQVGEKIKQVIEEFDAKQKSFAWWVGPQSKPDDLSSRLRTLGFKLEDVYIGLAAFVEPLSLQPSSEWIVKEALTELELRAYVSVNARVWGMDASSVEAAVKERLSYVSLPERRGGYLVARTQDGEVIGNGSYRISSDGQTLYLVGSAVLPEYRNRGVYRALLQYRFHRAKEAGCKLMTVQARVGTSEPILRKLGFQEYCKFEMYIHPYATD